ncbi:reverse transcriptase family protein [Robertkochia solimangrovi]|uniref:reverse transcriptase family protein n=1 Tax=Robertkochia solimangrovi TaxID=2213046 RepID=UPI00117D0CD7|nr:reverse transcriptase family protein [Robertkochia solimangrovi]TRZ41673.1 hypothetical protein DMZ48_16840 [Robertkochia solimangrovi]
MIKSVKDLRFNYLNISEQELDDLLLNVENYYNSFQKKQVKPGGRVKTRDITEVKGRLKIIHKAIFKNILSKIEYPSPPFIGGLKGKDNILNAYLHQGKPYIFCTDLKNFYPHINNRMVYKTFLNRGFSHDVSSILTKLTTFNGRLIQGGTNSTHIAYLTLWDTAHKLIQLCSENEIVFTIYVDDLTFSSEKDFKNLSIQLRDIIIEDGFFVNHSKTFFTKGKADITGVKVGQNTLNVKEEFRSKLENSEGLTVNQKKGLFLYYERVVSFGKHKV